MKIYISADIEGITGIAHWDEATRDHPAYPEFQQRMPAEPAARERMILLSIFIFCGIDQLLPFAEPPPER